MKNVQFIHGVNVSEDEINANVEWALARSDEFHNIGGRAVIIGGGPSLKGTLKEVCERHDKGGAQVFALNNAWRPVQAAGLAVDYGVIMDARQENADFVHGGPPNWYVASQCHKDVFERLLRDKARVTLWHVAGSTSVSDRALTGVIGGGTVLSRAISIAHEFHGTRHFILAGVDSSHSEDCHHAYEQALNDGDETMLVYTPDGTGPFKTTPEFAAQADYVMSQMVRLQNKGCTFEILGDGLLPTLWREYKAAKDKPEVWEPQKYKRMWERPEYRHYSPAQSLFPKIVAAFDAATIKKKKLIDYGTGTGRMALMFQQMGVDVLALDFADNCMDPEPASKVNLKVCNLWEPIEIKKKADLGTCIDVMEHIPTDKVDAVLKNIASTCNKCVFHIAYEADNMGTLIGEPLHLTVRPASWWQQKLERFFKNIKTDGELWIAEA